MKKIVLVLFLCVALLMGTICLFGCEPSVDKVTCYVPDGAPALAVAKIMAEGSVGNTTAEVVVTTGEDVSAKCVSGEADIAVLPTNAAVKICSTRDDYCIFSVNVYGVLYVVGTRQVSLEELSGQLVYSIGLGNTPEYVFKTILDGKNIVYDYGEVATEGKVSLQYVTDASSVVPLILQGKVDFALLGEPAVTNLINKATAQNKNVYRLFDLQQLWQETVQSDVAGYPQACLVVKKSLLTNSFAKQLKDTLWANSDYLNSNLSALNVLMQEHGSSLDVTYTADLITRCNLTAIMATDAKEDIEKYLSKFSALSSLLPVKSSVYYEQNH